jgi:type IV fimbrial biogenesis protein FimT
MRAFSEIRRGGTRAIALQSASRLSGMTLVELMVAIAMLCIVLSIGFPTFTGFVQDNRITTETNRLVSNLNYARSEASSRATVVTISRKSGTDKVWHEGWEIYTDADDGGNSARVVSDTFLRDVSAAGNGVRIRASDPGDRWISYRADGMLNEGGNALAIAVCDDRGEANGRDITVSLVGRVSVTSPSADCTP